MNYKGTKISCYTGYITQAIINNLAPILFIIFRKDFGFSFSQLGSLVLKYVRQIATPKNSDKTRPITKKGVFDCEVRLLFEPKIERITTAIPKDGTIPAELKR